MFLYRARLSHLFTISSASPCVRNIEMASSATDHSIAFVTCPNEEVGKTIARGLVEKKLAACVNIIPKVTSIYLWQGKVEEDTEVLLKIKTRASMVSNLTSYVRDNHPYDVPEIITAKIDQGNDAYLKWMTDVVPKSEK